jgi:hypothetical protein
MKDEGRKGKKADKFERRFRNVFAKKCAIVGCSYEGVWGRMERTGMFMHVQANDIVRQ